MRIGIIDLGTNSIRFDVHDINPKSVSRLYREKLMVRLGQEVFVTGKLNAEAKHRTLHSILRFKQVIQSLHVQKTIAFATSALREAEDRKDFLESVRKQTGIQIQVISGKEEARLIALGVLANEPVPSGKFALVDIGGGSTEVSLCRGRQVLESVSFPLGVARLQQMFLKRIPPHPDAVQELRNYIRKAIRSDRESNSISSAPKVIGSSGTVRALTKILAHSASGVDADLKGLRKLVSKMCKMDRGALLALDQMEEKRADLILPGAVLLEEIMMRIKADRFHATSFSLRDGILAEEIEIMRKRYRSTIVFHLDDVKMKALQLGTDPIKLDKSVAGAMLIFDKLKKVHGLKKSWQPYLLAAAKLKDVGESVGYVQHEVHSAYIAKHADIPEISPWESEFISQLCLLHENVKIEDSKIPFRKMPRRQDAFLRVLALLHVVDSLDCGLSKRIPLTRIRIEKKRVHFYFAKRLVPDLEVLRLNRKKKLFEEVFLREVEIHRR